MPLFTNIGNGAELLGSQETSHMLRPLVVGCVLTLASLQTAVAGTVELVRGEDQVQVLIDGQEFTIFHFAKSQPKPYFSPVRAADGTIVTRPLDDPNDKDHPHHKGIWNSIDEVNGNKHWAEKQKIVTQSVELPITSGPFARLKAVNHWNNDAGEPVLVETAVVDIHANRLMVFDFTFEKAKEDVVFEDTKEGLFGVRLATSMREKAGLGGLIVDSEGRQTMKNAWGQRSKWVDYSGPVDGKTYGIAIFDSPENFRPSRYHVRDYGLFSVSPFGEGAYQNDKDGARPVHLNAEHPSLKLRYGLYVHSGDVTRGRVADVYSLFLGMK